MVGVKFSPNYEAVKKRIQRLPKLVNEAADTFSKKDAVFLIETFQKGLSDGSFPLQVLKPDTEKQKAARGYSKPQNPLYGAGASEDKSYYNLFRIRKIKNGYRVYARWAKHHDSALPLRVLFGIHENGALIKQPNGAIIRIPPRPAFRLAYQRYLKKRVRQENVRKVQDAINALISGREKELQELGKKSRETDKYDET